MADALNKSFSNSSPASWNGEFFFCKQIFAKAKRRFICPLTTNFRASGKTSRNAGASTAVFAAEDADYVLADGYNIIFAWEELSALAKDDISAARDALVSELSRFASMTHAKVIAVFDAYRIKGHARENTVFQDVQLIYTKEEETADQYIERFANRYAPRNKVLVITSDGTEQVVAQGQGCRLISSREFKTYLDSMTQQFNEKYKIK